MLYRLGISVQTTQYFWAASHHMQLTSNTQKLVFLGFLGCEFVLLRTAPISTLIVVVWPNNTQDEPCGAVSVPVCALSGQRPKSGSPSLSTSRLPLRLKRICRVKSDQTPKGVMINNTGNTHCTERVVAGAFEWFKHDAL